MSGIENPFTFGNPIRDPSRFYGRQSDIRQVVNRLQSSARESTSIVGERRIGKTSLLNHLSNPAVASNLGLAPERFCIVYIDFQGLTDITPARFWQRVLKKIGRSLCQTELRPPVDKLAAQDNFDLFDIEDLFTTIGEKDLTTVLLLDEFEYVTQNQNFKADFFGGLRGLAIHQNLALVTATRRELVDLCHSQEIKGSPFFNIFANVVLHPFSNRDVNTLLEGSLESIGLKMQPEERDLVMRLGGGYPFFVQMAGYYWVEAWRDGLTLDKTFKQVSNQFDLQADPHFSYLWSHCNESERITLLAVLSLNLPIHHKKNLPRLENLTRLHARASIDLIELTKRGLLLEDPDQGTYSLFSPSLERWIRKEISADHGEQESPESLQNWLKGGGKDTIDPVKGFLPKFKKKYWPLVSTVLKEMSFEVAGAAAFELLIKALF